MTVAIREASEHDFEFLIQLFREFAVFEKLPHKMVNTKGRMMKERDLINCLVAEADGKIIGYASYFFCYYTWIGKSLFLDDLYITPAFRGQGIGKKLFNEVRNIAKMADCHKMRWQVSSWNASAIDFYKTMGAQIDDVERICDLLLE